MSLPVLEVPCPECGYEGPHTLQEVKDGMAVIECGGCYCEFETPND